MHAKKVKPTLATRGKETFEFAPVRQIDAERFVSNVQNHSHDDGEAHIYPVFFTVEQCEGVHVRVTGCGCPADEFHEGECKHRQTAAECADLIGRVIAVALDEDDEETGVDATEQTDGGRAIADGGQPENCECLEDADLPCWDCVDSGRKSLNDEHELRTDGGEDQLNRLEDGQVFYDSSGTRWTIDKRVTRDAVPQTRLEADTGEVKTLDPREFVLAVNAPDGEFSLPEEVGR